MTSLGSEVMSLSGRWSLSRWWWLFSVVLSLHRCDVHAAHSLSVLDSRLSPFYQKYRRPYDIIEPGFVADPNGYELRNALQPHHPAARDNFKAAPAKYPIDGGGYNTKTIPVDHYPHDIGGYATQNAFKPHYSTGHEPSYPADDGYNTKTIGFPMYQDYQPSYHLDGYATQNVFYHPYRSGKQSAAYDASTDGPDKYLTNDGYHTRTAGTKWTPLYKDTYHQYPAEHGGYATQNAFHPYRSGVEVASYEMGRADSDEMNYKAVDESNVGYKQVYYSNDDNHDEQEEKYRQQHYENNYKNDDDDDELSTLRPAAATNEYNFIHTATQPTSIASGGGWRSAVGRRPNIHVDVHAPSSTNKASSLPPAAAAAASARYSNFDITIDRFAQEEDVTGSSFAEPIGYLSDRETERSSRHLSRSVSKESDVARHRNSFDSQRAIAHEQQRSYMLDPCVALPDGDYPLDDRFSALLPGVSSRCNFIKCAHHSTFVNACSTGTRNPEHDLGVTAVTDHQITGAHYCSVRDIDNQCEHGYYHSTAGHDLLNTPDVKHYYSV